VNAQILLDFGDDTVDGGILSQYHVDSWEGELAPMISVVCPNPKCENLNQAMSPYRDVTCSLCGCKIMFKPDQNMRILCQCGALGTISVKDAGKKATCRNCQQEIVVPLFSTSTLP
jgi:DNA-directed RNA polymerase subunit RPC12/RpoP